MKTPSVLLASFFFLLFAFATTAEDDALDSDGDPMYNGGVYFITPVRPHGSHAIMTAAIKNGESNECSLAVVAGRSSNGWATKIANFVKPTFLLTKYAATISFDFVPPNACTNSSTWVVQRSPTLGKKAVMLPSSEDARQFSIFEVVPYGTDESNTYKLVYCGSDNDDECENIGLDVEHKNKYRPLIVTDGEPLVVKFEKAFPPIPPHLSMVV